jgi:hypothetical protein
MNVSSQVEMLDALVPNLGVFRARHGNDFSNKGTGSFFIDLSSISERHG